MPPSDESQVSVAVWGRETKRGPEALQGPEETLDPRWLNLLGSTQLHWRKSRERRN